MPKSELLQIRVDTKLKQDAENLFADLGLDTPTAVRLFLKQALAQNGIPFALMRGGQKAPENKEWPGLLGEMEQPVHAENYKKITREELYERQTKLNV
jgi:addiction module RelB/DinJ family antitoxin